MSAGSQCEKVKKWRLSCVMAGSMLLGVTLLPGQGAAWPSDGMAERAYQSSDNFDSYLLAAGAASTDPFEFFRDNVDSGVQSNCLACHRAGGSAPESGARLVLGEDAQKNHSAFASLLDAPDVSQRYVLSKITGGDAHGGGAVVAQGSAL